MLQTNVICEAIGPGPSQGCTLGHQQDSRLRRLLHAIGQPELIAVGLRLAAMLGRSWRGELVARGPRWPSDITDDHSPFEFSLALAGPFRGTEGSERKAFGRAALGGGVAGPVAAGPARAHTVRLLSEPQDPRQPSLAASWALAADIHEELASGWGASFESHGKVADLFAPSAEVPAIFSVWHSAILWPTPEFKVYLNPAIHGGTDAERVLDAALARLGMSAAWQPLRALLLRRPGLDVPVFFSVDLSRAPGTRVKVYVAHNHALGRDVGEHLAHLPGFRASDVEHWLRHLTASSGPYRARAPITCLAFDGGRADLHSATLHVPVRSYLPEDFDIARRVCELLGPDQQVIYLRALALMAERPLTADRGLQTYVSLRATPGREAVTIYLAPQVYTPGITPTSIGAR